MDGYAVRSQDTATAPVKLEVIGVVAAGRPDQPQVEAGQAVQIMTDDGHRVRVMYIDPDAVGLKQGQRVVAGETPIGKAQDLTKIYPPNKEGVMTNHTHIDVWKDGRFKDPTPFFERDVR